MHYAIIGFDKPDASALRQSLRQSHREFLHGDLTSFGATVMFGGPLLTEDGNDAVGTLVVIEASSLEAAQSIAAKDPYTLNGLFARLDVIPWRFAVGRHSENAS